MSNAKLDANRRLHSQLYDSTVHNLLRWSCIIVLHVNLGPCNIKNTLVMVPIVYILLLSCVYSFFCALNLIKVVQPLTYPWSGEFYYCENCKTIVINLMRLSSVSTLDKCRQLAKWFTGANNRVPPTRCRTTRPRIQACQQSHLGIAQFLIRVQIGSCRTKRWGGMYVWKAK